MGRKAKAEEVSSSAPRRSLSRNESDLKKKGWENTKPGGTCPEPFCGAKLEIVYNERTDTYYLQCEKSPSNHCRRATDKEAGVAKAVAKAAVLALAEAEAAEIAERRAEAAEMATDG